MKVFKEEQRFTQLWLHILLMVSFILPVVIVIKEYIEANDAGESKIALLTVLGSLILVYGLIYSLKLTTRIDEKGISYRFIPFHFSNRSINWGEIEKAYVRKYDPISDYGGWGIKGGALWNKSKGIAYNVKGDIGLQLILKNGKKILIGTQKQEDVKRVLETYKSKLYDNES